MGGFFVAFISLGSRHQGWRLLPGSNQSCGEECVLALRGRQSVLQHRFVPAEHSSRRRRVLTSLYSSERVEILFAFLTGSGLQETVGERFLPRLALLRPLGCEQHRPCPLAPSRRCLRGVIAVSQKRRNIRELKTYVHSGISQLRSIPYARSDHRYGRGQLSPPKVRVIEG